VLTVVRNIHYHGEEFLGDERSKRRILPAELSALAMAKLDLFVEMIS